MNLCEIDGEFLVLRFQRVVFLAHEIVLVPHPLDVGLRKNVLANLITASVVYNTGECKEQSVILMEKVYDLSI